MVVHRYHMYIVDRFSKQPTTIVPQIQKIHAQVICSIVRSNENPQMMPDSVGSFVVQQMSKDWWGLATLVSWLKVILSIELGQFWNIFSSNRWNPFQFPRFYWPEDNLNIKMSDKIISYHVSIPIRIIFQNWFDLDFNIAFYGISTPHVHVLFTFTIFIA